MKTNLSIVLFFVLLFAAGLYSSSQYSDPVVTVEDSDEAMNSAIETARSTFPQFLKRWKSMPNDGASVKVGLPTSNGGVEHIWFNPTHITDEKITATCSNNPANIPNLKHGDVRTFNRSELSDWMILVGNKCYGGYTIRVLAKMEPENAPPITFADFQDTP